jgi:excinuclease ABC subunit A
LSDVNLTIPRDKLVVFTGVSGSGKSSLAFDTIYAEGQRRYVESLSAYARQFLEQMDKPDVDSIEGLSPAISIEQKTTSHNPRSTVGTVTEIYDYLRLLFARIGRPHCPSCGQPITAQTVQQMVDALMELPAGSRLSVMAPIVRDRKGEYRKELQDARRAGFVRARIDGALHDLADDWELNKQKKHTIEIIVDRVVLRHDDATTRRLADSLEIALKQANGLAGVSLDGEKAKEFIFSEKLACVRCGISYPELTPRLFSFNSPHGACPACDGLGHEPPAVASAETGSDYEYEDIDFGTLPPCPACKGDRLKPESLSVLIQKQSIAAVTRLSIRAAGEFFQRLTLTEREKVIAQRILKEIRERLGFLMNVGLDYLTLDRAAATLSGGEGQRIRLATQIGSGLVGVLYILDEPSIGLHQRDNRRLLGTLLRLRDLGNTVIVVEHDAETMRQADYLLDLGPGPGIHGGHIVAQGTPAEVMANKTSLTGQYLRGDMIVKLPHRLRPPGRYLTIVGAREHNLKNISVKIPLGLLTCVTGVSGSGKSTLVFDVLFRSLHQRLFGEVAARRNAAPEEQGPKPSPGTFGWRSFLRRKTEASAKAAEKRKWATGCVDIKGTDYINKVINIDQSPIGRTPRSNPATYTGLFTAIRDLFSNLPESRVRGYKAGRYSFNVKGGRCEACQGDGLIKIEMHFLPDVYVTCEVCKGRRYNRETLDVLYKEKNIADVLEMTVEEALAFFKHLPMIQAKLATLYDVGLGYIKLGQSATTLSGGEAQRVKLSRELSKRATGNTLYILDEPTTGLHFADIQRLLDVLNRLVEAGNTVLVIEHNIDVIRNADWIIDLGPEGGDRGGEVLGAGAPKEIAELKFSYTGQVLRETG